MKTHLRKLMATAVLGLALVSNSLPAWAGVATINEVYISPSRTNAQGSLTGARYSADSTQYIGCQSHSQLGSTAQSVYCSAADKTGRSLFCFSTDPRIVNAVKGMTDSSHLDFAASRDPFGNYLCTDLTVSNESIYLK